MISLTFVHRGRFQFGGDQRRQFLHPLAQRRDEQGQAVQPVKKILAKFSLPHLFEERAVRGADDPRVGVQHLLRAESLEFAIFEHAQDFDLGEGTHLGNLVEKERAPSASSNLPFDRLLRAGERASLVTEELALDQAYRSWPRR